MIDKKQLLEDAEKRRPSNRQNLAGQRFGKLLVIAEAPSGPRWRTRYLTKCDCGQESVKTASQLKSGRTRSCGCLRYTAPLIHGAYRNGQEHPLGSVWNAMKRRCYAKNDPHYHLYGGRGITVADEWKDFATFFRDMAPTWKPGLTIDRINNDGPYSRENCRWATHAEQQTNKRDNRWITHKGRTKLLHHWALELGVSDSTIRHRLSRGRDIEGVPVIIVEAP